VLIGRASPGRGPLRFLPQELLRRQSRRSERNIGKVAVLDQRPDPARTSTYRVEGSYALGARRCLARGWRSRGAAVATLRAPGECSNLLG
jgi:hypothetical protein